MNAFIIGVLIFFVVDRDYIISELIKFKHLLFSFLDLMKPKRQYEPVNPHLQNILDALI